jgi:hypothetical protein
MKILVILVLLINCMGSIGQKVGIGTNSPLKLLSLKGSLLIDQGNENNATLDSAALRFGTNTGVGIASNRTIVSNANYNGLDIYTNNIRRISISNAGLVGIGDISPSYLLDVNGSLRATGGITGNSFLTLQGTLNAYSNVNAYEDLYVADYVGIGVLPSSTYRLRVEGNLLVATNIGINGNMRLDGTANIDGAVSMGSNLSVGGTANISGKLTNEGKGIVLSNSSTTLRMGFVAGTFSIALVPGTSTDILFVIPTFSGNNSNVRVSVSQFQPGAGASNWAGVVMTPHSIDASDASQGNASTVKVRFYNSSSSNANLGSNSVLYLLVAVTN